MTDFQITPTIRFDKAQQAIATIDQTLLPGKLQVIYLKTQEEVWEAIKKLRVRGAPAIGVAAAFGIYMGALEIKEDHYDGFYRAFTLKKEYLASSRPTAVNLFWALDRMENVVTKHQGEEVGSIKERLYEEARAILDEDAESCRAIGRYGAALLKEGDGVLTHCNAGRLATVAYGTALAPMYIAQENGVNVKVYADETRPLLQGARLTAFELFHSGIDTTVLCDNMAATAMKEGKIQIIFVGADRIAANGDAANKIGTLGVAILAKYYGIPFYVCAPLSTVDMNTATGDDIVIEQRDPEEVTTMWYKEPMAPEGVSVLNPAFDVTDHTLIRGIITDYGIAEPPFDRSLKNLFNRLMAADTRSFELSEDR